MAIIDHAIKQNWDTEEALKCVRRLDLPWESDPWNDVLQRALNRADDQTD